MKGRPSRALAPAAVAVVLLSALAGCLADAGVEEPTAPAAEAGPAARVTAVVADVGPGTNPYHEVFRRPGWTEHPSAVIPGFPEGARPLNLTLGDDYAASLAADEAAWAAYEEGVLYYVPGTNLLLLTTRAPSYVPLGHTDHRGGHGVATSGAMALACPACYVLVVQDDASVDGEPVRRIAEEMPWVDFVASTNAPGDPGLVPFQHRAHAEATKALHDTGRLFFGFSGNRAVTGVYEYVNPFPFAEYAFPTWVVPVGGGHAACASSDVLAGKPPELVGDFDQTLPWVETVTERIRVAGTSFSTPQVAALFAHALLQVRAELGDARAPGALWTGEPRPTPALEDGRLDAEDLRAAFSATARYFGTTEYESGCGAQGLPTSAPVSPAPWLEMGWGYAGMEEAEAAARVVLGHEEAPAKPEAARAWMAAYMDLRAQLYG